MHLWIPADQSINRSHPANRHPQLRFQSIYPGASVDQLIARKNVGNDHYTVNRCIVRDRDHPASQTLLPANQSTISTSNRNLRDDQSIDHPRRNTWTRKASRATFRGYPMLPSAQEPSQASPPYVKLQQFL
ncbi:hypothetical protein Bca101_044704 [Brassica carinata]